MSSKFTRAQKFYRSIRAFMDRLVGFEDEKPLLHGFVQVIEHRPEGDVTVSLGKNVITEAGRLNVSRILARTAAEVGGGVTFPDDEGVLIESTDVLPRRLWIGTGTTSAKAEDTSLESRIGTLEYSLARIRVFDQVSDYSGNAPYVGWEFDIPAGPLDAEPSAITIQEWGLYNEGTGSDVLLARKVKPFEKQFEFSMTVRWLWRT